MKTNLLICALAISLNACAVDPVDTSTNPTTEDDTSFDEGPHQEKLAANGLTPEDIQSLGITANTLTQTVVNNLSVTKQGRGALLYLIQCAMPTSFSITGTYTGGSFTYVGQFGLAPTWSASPLNQTSQRTVSSCLFSRLNAFGRNVTISIRGTGYGMDPGEAASHIYPEGIFYGNLFPGADNYWGACDSDGPTHVDRQCAQPGNCSMANPGISSCAATCSLDASGTATSCVANGRTYANPTTVFLDAVSP